MLGPCLSEEKKEKGWKERETVKEVCEEEGKKEGDQGEEGKAASKRTGASAEGKGP